MDTFRLEGIVREYFILLRSLFLLRKTALFEFGNFRTNIWKDKKLFIRYT